MLLVDRHSETAARRSVSDPSGSAQLRFRVDGRVVELQPGKTTIGSSPRCTLRIEGPGIAPVHCLVVRDGDQVSVRRWAADTQLNGAPFDEALFKVGDCLALAGVELDFVGPPTANDAVEASMRKADAAASVCDAWLSSEQAPIGDEEYLGAGLDGVASVICAAETRAAEEAVEVATPSVSDAAEVVFRELQLACEVSRGRGRKLLAALRVARETNRELTNLLAAGRDELAELDRERLDWEASRSERSESRGKLEVEIQGLRREISELEGRLADHTGQMAELQTQLANVRVGAPPVFVSAVDDCDAELSAAPPFDLPVMPVESSINQDDASLDSVEVEAVAEEGDAWTPPAATCSGWGSLLNRASEPVEPSSGAWGEAARQFKPADDFLGDEALSQELEVEAPAWADDVASNPVPSVGDGSPVDDVSIWKKEATDAAPNLDTARNEASFGDSEPFAGWEKSTGGAADFEDELKLATSQQDLRNAVPNLWRLPRADASDEGSLDVAGVEPVAAKLPQTSYIERYAHMFADEPAGDVPVAERMQPVASESLVSKPRTMGIVRNESGSNKPVASDDEESIEQYMAKLLQRVRGDMPQVPASQGAQPAATDQEAATDVSPLTPEATVSAAIESMQPVDDEPETEEEAAQAMVDWEAIARRAVAAGPTANLGALRALANESARSAIGRHALKKHRRDAATKMIVSTLAGVTSLWLMLEAPSWRDIQFIAACVSLIVAAYWAGEACRAMLESFRAAAYDGPSAEHAATESYDGSALPIDVDATR